ncbi:MAG: Cystathionine beta-lyase PatB [Bacteroidetes bacterium ADurb.Bin145]|nr:MAG: Cystathionine beta-lyase PatB [Bacteroidetes bacterium ADurb.Bin145]
MNWEFDEIINREGTDSVKYDLRQEIFGRNDIIPMWVADMDFKTPDFIVKRLNDRLRHEIYGYSFRSPEYFNSIVRWLRDRHKWNIEKDWICFSPGIVPALNLCTLAFTRPGDSVIVQPPVYFPFFPAVESHGRNLVYNQLIIRDDRWTMDFDGLISSITERTKMIMISNPHNPVGRVWSDTELKKLASICLEKKIIILSDEIHNDLIIQGYKHTPVANISEEISDITVTCIAPSKTFNLAGLSTSSVIISNPVLRKYFKKKIDDLHIGNGNIFGTEASIAAYTHGHKWVDALMDYINRNAGFVISYCKDLIPEIIPVRPEGTYMIWLDCRKLSMGTKEIQDFFVNKAGVGMNEGSQFGPGGEGFMRMNVATSIHKVEEAMTRIEKAVAAIR